MRKYSKEFKERAILLSEERANKKELAEELGISAERLYKWRSKARNTQKNSGFDPGGGACPTAGVKAADVKKLQKENEELRLELEILKKAVHIFSRSDGRLTSL